MLPRQSTRQRIRDHLRGQLGTRWRVGEHLPPVTALARDLGCGRESTLHAVKMLAAEGLVDSRPGRGTVVIAAPAAPTTRRVTIYTTGDHPDGFITEITDALRDALQAADCADIVSNGELRKNYNLLDKSTTDAVVYVNPDVGKPIHFDPRRTIVSVISTSQSVDAAGRGPYDVVTVDERQGAALAGGALRCAGCDSAFFVGMRDLMDPANFDETSAARLAGFESAFGRRVPREHQYGGSGYSNLAGVKAAREYIQLRDRPQGVFCASDDFLVGFVMAAMGFGLTPGVDYAIAGFDGQRYVRRAIRPTPASVTVPGAEMGRRAADLLIKRFADRDRPYQTVALPCTLYAGRTVRPDLFTSKKIKSKEIHR